MSFYFKTRIYRYKLGRVYSLLMEQELLTLPEHLSSLLVFVGFVFDI